MAKTHRRTWTYLVALAMACTLVLAGLTACKDVPQSQTQGASDADSAEKVEVRVGLINAPASWGLVPFANKAREGKTDNDYTFVYQRTYEEINTALTEDMLDIAVTGLLPAAKLYAATEGGVEVLDVAGMAGWTLVSSGKTIKDFDDLAGRTLYIADAYGAEGFTIRYLLELAGIRKEVNLEYLSGDSQIVAQLSEDPLAAGVVYGTNRAAAVSKIDRLRKVVDIEDVWSDLTEGASQCVGYVVVARKDFVAEHPEAVAEFLAEHEASAAEFVADPITYAPDVVNMGLFTSEEGCVATTDDTQITCIPGAQMKLLMASHLQVYADRAIVHLGGSLPGDDFYYLTDDDQKELEELIAAAEAAQEEADGEESD